MSAKTTNKKTAAKAEVMESKSIYVRGIITEAMYGKREFGKGKDSKDKYRVSLKIEPADMKKLIEEAEPFYEETDEKWIPKWFTDEDAREYINLSSNYDIKIGQKNEKGELEDLGKMMEFIEANGNINGSKVVMMLTLKPGAVYPQAILIKELKKQTIADMFAGAEGFMDIPSEIEEELPFT